MALPWAEMMTAGFGHLRLPPDVFWSMTLREFSFAISQNVVAANSLSHPKRDQMEALMKAYPDTPDNQEKT